MIAKILTGLVALAHFYFMWLEMFAWTTPRGLKAFGMTPEQAETMAVLAANQGLYNGLLAAGLVWSLAHPNPDFARQIAIFFLGCVVVAGLYGGYSANPKIYFLQALPAALGILAWILRR